MAAGASYGCRDYRQEMILVGLRERLRGNDLSEEERRKLQEQIRRLEDECFR
ncbi:MAG: hypothetical protein PVF97_07630 [Desulfobacterales bacterium]|jgi:hypothetical protein